MEFKYMLLMLPAILIILLSILIAKNNKKLIPSDPIESFYDLNSNLINWESIEKERYRGKKILIVNVASRCGLTPQYSELEKLYKTYSENLIILGFPSNDFFRQEPRDNKEIAEFCSKSYDITFPLFEKIHVKGSKKHHIYEWLTNPKKNGWNKKGPSWNFTKYLIDENGKLIERFSPRTTPLSDNIIALIK